MATKKQLKPTVKSPIKTPVKNPIVEKQLKKTATPTGSAPKGLISIPGGVSSPGFFSAAGQKTALKRVADVLNPFSNQPIRLAGTNLDVGAYVRTLTRTGEAALALPLASKLLKTSYTAPTAAVAAKPGMFSRLGGLFTAAGIGAGAAFLLSDKNKQTAAPQTQTPTQNSTQYTEANQDTYAPVDARTYQRTKNIIRDSPGSSISSSQAAEPRVVVSPGQDVIPSLSPTQALEQGQTQSNNTQPWLLIAAIAAGAYLLGGRK